MSEILVGLISGFIFGLGLCLSGLADPSVVQGFLDVAGTWNPALLFVMGAGLTVTLIGYRLVFGRGRPLWSPRFNLPTSTAIDTPLISGAVIFGVGWGLAGYCPGPALVSLASGRIEVFVFVTAMVTGMIAVRWMRASPRLYQRDYSLEHTYFAFAYGSSTPDVRCGVRLGHSALSAQCPVCPKADMAGRIMSNEAQRED